MKIKELIAGFLGLQEYQERRKLVQKLRVDVNELVDKINYYREEKSTITKEKIIPHICVDADNITRTAREVMVVLGDNPELKLYLDNIFQCVNDILTGRSVIHDLKETLSDSFEQRTDDFDSFKIEAKKQIAETDAVINVPMLSYENGAKIKGLDIFGDKLNSNCKQLLEFCKPLQTQLFYNKKVITKE